MFFKKVFYLLFFFAFSAASFANYWQQKVDYEIDVLLNDSTHQFKGIEKINYKNNSPDTLKELYVHLYWNAFQPNSSMDIRSRNIADPDKRVGDKIFHLHENEIGFQKIASIKMKGKNIPFEVHETILKIFLATPILPNENRKIDIAFEAQVPKQIRRSGRNNAEGVMYSMSQWYPKVCAYDNRGWHPNQYIAREFYGEWGEFVVRIAANKKFTIAATGVETKTFPKNLSPLFSDLSKDKKIWQFTASPVHDFVWVADTAFMHIERKIKNENLTWHFYYKKGDSLQNKKWNTLANKMDSLYPLLKNQLGAYPYTKYSFIQGGDGGMEYPMATLIKSADIETGIHEWVHSWFQGMCANNESDYAWMDEGFTNYMTHHLFLALEHLPDSNLINEMNFYLKKISLAENDEAMSFPSDHFNKNGNYSLASYVKGALLLQQLEYLIGENKAKEVVKSYTLQWRFKHPQPNDFFNVAERISGLQLKWFQSYWTNSSKTIDYKIDTVKFINTGYEIDIQRIGLLPMPIELNVLFEDSTEKNYYIPLDLMLGNKKDFISSHEICAVWKWVAPHYVLKILNGKKIKQIKIDKTKKMADVISANNFYTP